MSLVLVGGLMAKGECYRLVDVEGVRRLCVPLSLWPSLTGIISDNEFQFEGDCWRSMIAEVLNVAQDCFPTRYSYSTSEPWTGAGLKIVDAPEVPGGKVRRITHVQAVQVSSGTADFRIATCENGDVVTIMYAPGIATGVPAIGMTDALQIKEDWVRLSATVTATSGTLYLRLWGEEWTP